MLLLAPAPAIVPLWLDPSLLQPPHLSFLPSLSSFPPSLPPHPTPPYSCRCPVIQQCAQEGSGLSVVLLQCVTWHAAGACFMAVFQQPALAGHVLQQCEEPLGLGCQFLLYVQVQVEVAAMAICTFPAWVCLSSRPVSMCCFERANTK